MERKILLVCRLRIITMTHIQDIVLYILLNHKPGTAAKAQGEARPQAPLIRVLDAPILGAPHR